MLSEEEKKAIEWLNKYIKNIKHEWQECDDSKAVRTVLNLITKLQKENEEKDKQIDLMAKYIAINGVEKDICNEKRIEENCKNVTEDNITVHRCKKCVKQYFADKVNSRKGVEYGRY